MIKKGLDSTTLKLIAIVAMFIDHFAVGVINLWLVKHGYYSFSTVTEKAMWMQEFGYVYYVYYISILIGRIAFPIFGFFLVEGLFYTRSRLKYLTRLLIFGIISEIPFNLINSGGFIDLSRQNVMFSLLIAGIAIVLLEGIRNWIEKKKYSNNLFLLSVLIIGTLASYLAYICKTDYKYAGIIMILAMYLTRSYSYTVEGIAAAAVMNIYKEIEITTILDIPLLMLYNGKRGLGLKYVFYLFYPVHLLIIYMISICLNLRSFPI